MMQERSEKGKRTGLSRRELLGSAAMAAVAGGSASALQATEAGGVAEARSDAADVVVIGGGFAGVTAARDLSRQGVRVTLLEATARFGGRTLTVEDIEGYQVELGGTWVHWMQPHVWLEIERYGMHVKDMPVPERMIYVDADGRHEVSPLELFPDSLMALEEFFEESRLLWDQPYEAGRSWEALTARDSASAAERLKEIELSPRARLTVKAYLEVMGHCAPGDVGFVEMSRWHALSGYSAGMIGDTTARYKIEEGTAGLIQAMADDGAPEVHFETVVRRIVQEKDRVRITTEDGDEIMARAAVVALPLNVLKDIEFFPGISSHKIEASRETHAGSGFKAYFVVEGSPGNLSGVADSKLNPFSYLGTYAAHGTTTLFVAFGVDARGFEVSDREAVERAFRAFVPDAKVLGSFGHKWVHDPYAQGTWCSYRPGQLTRHWRGLRAPEGRLVFAGGDLCEGWRGFMDGAIASGSDAARQVLELLG